MTGSTINMLKMQANKKAMNKNYQNITRVNR